MSLIARPDTLEVIR